MAQPQLVYVVPQGQQPQLQQAGGMAYVAPLQPLQPYGGGHSPVSPLQQVPGMPLEQPAYRVQGAPQVAQQGHVLQQAGGWVQQGPPAQTLNYAGAVSTAAAPTLQQPEGRARRRPKAPQVQTGPGSPAHRSTGYYSPVHGQTVSSHESASPHSVRSSPSARHSAAAPQSPAAAGVSSLHGSTDQERGAKLAPRPCSHNAWVKVNKSRSGGIVLRCIICSQTWKTFVDAHKKCAEFFAGKCTQGDACECVHIYARHRQKEALAAHEATQGAPAAAAAAPAGPTMPTPLQVFAEQDCRVTTTTMGSSTAESTDRMVPHITVTTLPTLNPDEAESAQSPLGSPVQYVPRIQTGPSPAIFKRLSALEDVSFLRSALRERSASALLPPQEEDAEMSASAAAQAGSMEQSCNSAAGASGIGSLQHVSSVGTSTKSPERVGVSPVMVTEGEGALERRLSAQSALSLHVPTDRRCSTGLPLPSSPESPLGVMRVALPPSSPTRHGTVPIQSEHTSNSCLPSGATPATTGTIGSPELSPKFHHQMQLAGPRGGSPHMSPSPRRETKAPSPVPAGGDRAPSPLQIPQRGGMLQQQLIHGAFTPHAELSSMVTPPHEGELRGRQYSVGTAPPTSG
eukprot:TRINITY_DN822_c3_g1_i2.p1 TRINITY_DN822_c3_g1~~TRINITY_DN822_c3_g1_i2.p1  ORF type:complete len:655 (+),score=130.66 TRINITY_DN822_c3_g1_i2:91-1965(+)